MGDFEYEDYDFDVNEFSSSPPPSPPAYSATLPRSKQPLYGKKTPTPSYASSTPKSSVYEPMVVDRTSRGGVALGRAEEMLRKNKKPISVKAKQVEDLADDTVVDSIASSWDNIMRDFKVEDYDDNVITASVESPSPVEPPDMHFKTPQRLLSISSGGEDSFELTSADFEIGAIASKLTKARVLTREALTSESSAPLMPAKLVSSSPDVAKTKRADKGVDEEDYSLHIPPQFNSNKPPDPRDDITTTAMAFQMSTALSSIAVEKAPDGDFEESYDAIERERGSYGDHSSSATASKRSTRTSVEYEDQRLYEILADSPALKHSDGEAFAISNKLDPQTEAVAKLGDEANEGGVSPPDEHEQEEYEDDYADAENDDESLRRASARKEDVAAGEYDDTLATNEGVMASDWKDTVTSHLAETNSIEGNIGITSAGPVSKSAEDTEFQHQDERQWSELKNESDDAVLIASPVPVSFVRMEKAPSPPTSSPLSNLSPHTPLADVSSSSLEVTEVKNLVSSPPPLPPVIFPKSASYVHWSDAVLLTEEESKDEESTEEEIGLLQRAGVLNVAPPHPLHFSKPASAATSTTAMHSHQQGNTFSKGASAALRVSGPRRSAFMKETAVSSLKAKVREQKTAQQRKGMQTPSNESNVKRSMVKRPASPKAAQEVFADGNLTTDSSTVPLKRTFRSPSPSRMPSRLNKTKGAIIYSPERLSQSQQIFAKSSLKEKHCERLSKNDALEAREALLDLAIRDALVGVARSKDLPRERDVVPHVERGTDTDDAHDFLELESLKAQLFELQQSINGPLREGTDVVKLEFSPECDKKEMSSGPVTLTQKEYNKMQRDITSLETLVNGFQRENERMVSALKEKRMAEETLKARYFDERENLNRELNMYKNAAPLGVNVRKSATFLKDELEKDAIIFSLRERVANAEAGAGIREKEYQAEIEKLRAENRQLIVELKRIASEVNGKEKDQLEAALSESKRCAEECASLRAKLLWYAENQEIIDKGEQDRQDLMHDIRICKRQLKILGVDLKALNLTSKVAGGGGIIKRDDSDVTAIEIPAICGPNSKVVKLTRNPADIKKIKDLESLVKDLQQSIIKRHPDSIAALIQAAGASDSMELRRKDRDAVLTSLRAELTEVKAAGEKRLRALRQEYEKIKLQYDQKMSTEDRARATLAVAEEDVKAKHVERPRTLTQAVAIIKNLETEIEKVRTFYQKKVIELQTRHKKAMVALKKGEKVEEEIEYLLPSCNGKKKEEPVEAKTLGDTIQVTKDDKDLGAVPITPSPDELASSAGALVGDAPTKGQYHVTSELVSLHFQQQQQQFNQQQLVIAQQQSQIQQLETLFRLTNEKLAAKPEQPSSLPPSPPPSKAMSFCKRSEDAYIAEISLLQAQVKASEAATIILQTEVRDLMTRNTQLQGELEMIRRLPKSPQLEHFEILDNQLKHLEQRLARREQELMAAVEESKCAGRVERARLQSLHQQELHEKDELLLRFRSEMEALVAELRRHTAASDLRIQG